MAAQRAEILRTMAAEAMFLIERLRANAAAFSSPDANDLVENRLRGWAAALSTKIDFDHLHRRLTWDECDIVIARRALTPHAWSDALPAWISTFELTLEHTSKLSDTGQQGLIAAIFQPAAPVPFQEILLPFVSIFLERLAQHNHVSRVLTEQASIRLGQALLAQLSRYASQCLFLEFRLYCTEAQCSLEQFLMSTEDNSEKHLYSRFVEEINGDPLRLWSRYPVLARILSTMTDLWTEAQCEWVERLAIDHPQIESTFADGAPVGKVLEIRTTLADFHAGNRSVAEIEFENGLFLIYKPRTIGLELAWNSMLDWLNAQEPMLKLRVLAILDRGTYGWVEFVRADECLDLEEVKRFYIRSGMLLCLMYLLGGTDAHYENVIASGEHPVIVDNETLLSPHWRAGTTQSANTTMRIAWEQLSKSVLGTGMVPHWQLSDDQQKAWDISALGGFGEQEPDLAYPRWHFINTDKMELRFEPGALRKLRNLPWLHHQRQDVTGFADALTQGFHDMYEFIRERRDAMLAPDGPLHQFRGKTGRILYRATHLYGLLLMEMQQPKYQHDGAEFGFLTEMLAQAHLKTSEKPAEWPLFAAEVKALQQLDIPLLRCQTDQNSMVLESGEIIPDPFSASGFDEAVARFKNMSDENLLGQLRILSDSLTCRFGTAPEANGVTQSKAHRLFVPLCAVKKRLVRNHADSPDELIEFAREIGEELTARAIVTEEGATWTGPQTCKAVGKIALRPLESRLYDGACGIALFLGALSSATGSPEYRGLALGAIAAARTEFHQELQNPSGVNIGAALGLGGVIYTLVRLAHILGEPALLKEAEAIAGSIPVEQITADQQLDVIGGAAGAILGLLTLYETCSAKSALEKAQVCGCHLLNKIERNGNGVREWPSAHGRRMTGFAHGAAGIGYALIRLGEAMRLGGAANSRDFQACGQEALAREQSEFNSRLYKSGAEELSTWCSGAPGLGLALVGSLPWNEADSVSRDIETTLNVTAHALAHSAAARADHLCCGRIGQIEFLLTAGELLSRLELVEQARLEILTVLAEAKCNGAFRSWLHPTGGGVPFVPGFFTGTAGIGYTLLRLARPGCFPSVLLWR